MEINKYQTILENTKLLLAKRIVLRLFNDSDINDVFEYASDNEVVEFLTWTVHPNIEHTRNRFKDFFINKPGKFAIELIEEEKCIGCIDLRVDANNDKASFGYVLNRKYWNKGFMTEALAAIINFSFTTLKLNRIESTHYVGNEKSGKVMYKCGMKYEGLGKKEVKIKEKYMDVIHFGLLKEDWERKLTTAST